MLDKLTIIKKLNKVVDPEINIPITDMELVDEIDINSGIVTIKFHFSTPTCPPIFAYKIGIDIKKSVGEIEGVKKVKVNIKDHYLSDKINEELNKD